MLCDKDAAASTRYHRRDVLDDSCHELGQRLGRGDIEHEAFKLFESIDIAGRVVIDADSFSLPNSSSAYASPLIQDTVGLQELLDLRRRLLLFDLSVVHIA